MNNINEVRLPIEDYELVFRPNSDGSGYAMSVSDGDHEVPAMNIASSVRRIKGEMINQPEDVKIVSLSAEIVVNPDHPEYRTTIALPTPEDISPVKKLRDGRLWCEKCHCFVPNTANHEMRKEGAFAHSHTCGIRREGEWYEQNFSEVVDMLDRLKRLYFKLTYVMDNPSMFCSALAENAYELKKALSTETSALFGFAQSMLQFYPDTAILYWTKELSNIERYVFEGEDNEIISALDGIADDFYVTAGYGNRWDEVYLPACLQHALEGYVILLRPHCKNMVGFDTPVYFPEKGRGGVMITKLSNATIVFADTATAIDFANGCGTPVQICEYGDGCRKQAYPM